MKYIRTRNDKILDLDTMEFDWALPRENFVKSNAIKQADTIEELCDKFVLVGEKIAPKHSFLTFEQAKFNFKSLINQTYVEFAIYGAIWTNKGLIYVTKFNEKGELELL